MLSLAQQLTVASNHAMREAARLAEENRAKEARQAEVRARQWATRKGGPNIADALLERLPKTAAEAIDLSQVYPLLADFTVGRSSISGTLTHLVNQKSVARIGKVREYRYYVAEVKKP